MKSTRVIRRDASIFIPLPPAARRDIPGGCDCQWCLSHPECQPQWDTLSIATEAPKNGRDEYAVTVHYPEICEDRKRKTPAVPLPHWNVFKLEDGAPLPSVGDCFVVQNGKYIPITQKEWDRIVDDLPELILSDEITDQD